jgi:hypothetical protein
MLCHTCIGHNDQQFNGGISMARNCTRNIIHIASYSYSYSHRHTGAVHDAQTVSSTAAHAAETTHQGPIGPLEFALRENDVLRCGEDYTHHLECHFNSAMRKIAHKALPNSPHQYLRYVCGTPQLDVLPRIHI